MIRVRLRERIRQHRQCTGERITFVRLAERRGLSRQTVESLSSRQGYDTTPGAIAKVCRALNCQPSDLLIFELDQRNGPPH